MPFEVTLESSTYVRSALKSGMAVLASCDSKLANWNMPRATVERLMAGRAAKVGPVKCLAAKCHCQEYERRNDFRRGCLLTKCDEHQNGRDRSENK